MNWKTNVVIAAALSLVVISCGPSELPEEGEAPISTEQISQDIGASPSCPSSYGNYTGTLQSRTDVLTACGGCTTRLGAKPGIRTARYERCCTYYVATEQTTCGAWKLIEDACTSCATPD
ncbi:hypothetical protein [Pyxidicoccus sp. MSG2]|uniref:hypothetical protein n=1 Tax=Pyxidicoccus sp. MSG2 TaxID=2996790 RepID=UPI00226FBB15|nr:hypothetical protein [Pyxidicoccus sp. MSG2]MCY1022545.1 hypothetical protein [Pyxidicoccus sp. MSG2]